jgi:hypothetical protein
VRADNFWHPEPPNSPTLAQGSATCLHHGVRPIPSQQESIHVPMRPLLVTRPVSLPGISIPLHPSRPCRGRQEYDLSGFMDLVREIMTDQGDRGQAGASGGICSTSRLPESARGSERRNVTGDRRSSGERQRFLPPSVEGYRMVVTPDWDNESPPPYDAVGEHFDAPDQPPAYEHLFPERSETSPTH